jgi:predicted GNAT family acetyltransferase
MTAVRPDVRRAARAELLDDRARPQFQRLLDADPYVNAAIAARFAGARSLAAQRIGGHVSGVRDGTELAAACFAGSNLVLIGPGAAPWSSVASFVASRPRRCSSIVGRADAVHALWGQLEAHWGQPRAVRPEQPLLVLDRPPTVPRDREVRIAKPAQAERYLAAAAAMFAEELGVSPHVSPGTSAFRARVHNLIDARLAFLRVDFRGQVVFKAEIGALTRYTAQIQGVWVRPDLRGQGIGTAALATVLAHALTLAPTASLYVNDFNVAARRLYARLGMRHHATLATVLLP